MSYISPCQDRWRWQWFRIADKAEWVLIRIQMCIREKRSKERLRKERWVLPKPLSTLVPRRVMKNRITAPYDHLRAAKWFPGDSQARFQCCLVHLHTHSTIGGHPGDQEFSSFEVK